jgi:uncharacterized membrane protein YwaF
VLASLAYAALVVPVNAWLDGDYGYVGDPAPDISVPPFVLMLGPWPLRALILAALVPLGFVVVLLPWLIISRTTRTRS